MRTTVIIKGKERRRPFGGFCTWLVIVSSTSMPIFIELILHLQWNCHQLASYRTHRNPKWAGPICFDLGHTRPS
jgi:hypothetical protein